MRVAPQCAAHSTSIHTRLLPQSEPAEPSVKCWLLGSSQGGGQQPQNDTHQPATLPCDWCDSLCVFLLLMFFVDHSFPYVTCEMASVDVSDALGKVRPLL